MSFFQKGLEKFFGLKLVWTDGRLGLVKVNEIKLLRLVFRYFLFLLLFWGLYRLLFRLPESLEELVLKPFFWLGSLFYLVRKIEKKPLSSLGISSENLFRNLYWGIGLGFLFAIEGFLTNFLKYGQSNLIQLPYNLGQFLFALFLSAITAICEELVFRGFFFNRLWRIWKREWLANFVTSIFFIFVHLPIVIFGLHYGFYDVLIYAFLLFLYSLGAGFVFARTENVLSPILLHIFWGWPLVLFR